jgi:putative aldouronate transport system permease protein
MPYFISLVVLCGTILDFTRPEGLINDMLSVFGIPAKNWMLNRAWFKPVFVLTNAWQWAGWNSIVYMAALSAVDPELYDAAYMDGCGRFRRVLHVTLRKYCPL